MKVVSKEGHEFNSRREIENELVQHTAFDLDYFELQGWTEDQLLQALSDAFSVEMKRVD